MSEVVGANFSAKMLRLIDWSSTLLNFLGERRGSIFEGSVSALCTEQHFEVNFLDKFFKYGKFITKSLCEIIEKI